MLARTQSERQRETRPSWREILAGAVRDPAELLARLDLDPSLAGPARRGHALFPVLVPEPYLRRIRVGDPDDPLLRQVLPGPGESRPAPGFVADPVDDAHARRAPGVLQKYRGRALLIASGGCAINCRYCFRREFPYRDNHAAENDWQASLDWLRRHDGIQEVILSGGDPLLLPTARLRRLTDALARIDHIERLRIHTRLPAVIPQRVTNALCEWLRQAPMPAAVVLHVNHAREIDEPVRAALAALRDSGAMLLNQAVLLRGVNDRVEAQEALARTLFAAGVLPYYLHLLDRVHGTADYEVGPREGASIVAALRQRLSGYLVPRLVREEPGTGSKTPVHDSPAEPSG